MSGSVFDLKTSPAELPSVTQGTANLSYQQISSQPEVTNANFGGSTKRFKFDIQGTKWWVPSKSYFRLRLKFYQQDGATQPVVLDDIAPAMGLASGLFQSGELKFANRTVSKIEDNMAQIDALQTRLSKSKAWLDSIGAGSNFWQPGFEARQQAIVSDNPINLNDPTTYTAANLVGYPGSGLVNATTLVWTDVGGGTFANGFNDTNTWMQVGDIIKFPDDATGVGVKGMAIKVTGTAANGTFTFSTINSGTITADGPHALNSADFGGAGGILPQLYRAVNVGRNIQEVVWQPPLSIFNCQYALPVGSYEISLTPYPDATWRKNVIQSVLADKTYGAGNDYIIEIENMYLYISTMEGQRVDNMTYYLSLDECNVQPLTVDQVNANINQKKQLDVSPSTYALTCAFQAQSVGNNTTTPPALLKFSDATVNDTLLQQLYIQYAGQTRPSPYADPSYVAGTDYITQRWLEDNIYSGGFFDNGGGETKDDWLTRGPYYHFSWPKDGNDTSTRVYLNYAFSANVASGLANALLYSHYKKTVGVSISNGQITEVSEQLS